jgi:hypothetical protein
MHTMNLSSRLLKKFLLLVFLYAVPSRAFMVQPLSVVGGHSLVQSKSTSTCVFGPRTTTTLVRFSHNSNNNEEEDTLGVGNRGISLFLAVLLFNVWLFSIPPEFRRAKNCSAEQVRLNPDSKCMTSEMWWGGIAEYYRTGGSVQFDFSIEGKE